MQKAGEIVLNDAFGQPTVLTSKTPVIATYIFVSNSVDAYFLSLVLGPGVLTFGVVFFSNHMIRHLKDLFSSNR